MIVLQLEQEVAASPYFVARHLQRGSGGAGSWVVSGTLGDGWYEGEVTVETGSRSEVTFADEWFDPAALQGFFDRIDRDQVCSALFQVLAGGRLQGACCGLGQSQRPAHHPASELSHLLVGSGDPGWAAVA